MSTGGTLIVIGLVIWGCTELLEFVRRRRAGQSVMTSDNRGSLWLRGLNVVALVLAVAGFIIWFNSDPRFWGIGL